VELLDLKIKGKRAVWFTSVKTFGTEQLRNRFIHLNPDETAEQDDRVFELNDQLTLEDLNVDSEAFETAKAMSKIIVENTKNTPVFVPFYFKWPFKNRRWLYPMFLSFIKIIAKIHFKKRKTNEEGYLIAEKDDFELAKQLWKTFSETIVYRVSRSARDVFNHIPENPEDAVTHAELAEELPMSTQWISKLCEEELIEEGLINRRKRTKEGTGRGAWEYWKATIPNIEDIAIMGNRDFHAFKDKMQQRKMQWRKYLVKAEKPDEKTIGRKVETELEHSEKKFFENENA
jgi:predicted transcriptional regulator